MTRLALATLVITALGCGGMEDGTEMPDLGTRRDEVPGEFMNGLTTSGFVNALLGNASALRALANLPLSTTSFSVEPVLNDALEDADARQAMTYLVQCALDSSQSVQWKSDWTGVTYTFLGDIGLCPNWNSASPSSDCLQLVTACLLSRNNPLGRRVTLSARGEHPTAFKFWDASGHYFNVPTETLQPYTYNGVASFNACGAAMAGLRDCGWRPYFTGRCTPGTTVTVGAGAPCAASLGSSSGDTMLRVCEGLEGCTSFDGRMLGQNDNSCGVNPAVTFVCPWSGIYSVMEAPHLSTDASARAMPAASTGRLPANEPEVFRFREGAFYGNIFDGSKLNPAINVTVDNVKQQILGKSVKVRGAIYGEAWSCSDEKWTDELAYMTYRLCADPTTGENCAAKHVGTCYGKVRVCNFNDGAPDVGDLDFAECKGGNSVVYKQIITTALAKPCDNVGNERVCARTDR